MWEKIKFISRRKATISDVCHVAFKRIKPLVIIMEPDV